MRRWFFTVFLTALMVVGPTVRAWSGDMTFDLVGVNDPNLTATVVFNYDPATPAINLSITNNSLDAAGPDPRLTAVAFNLPDNVTGIDSFTGPARWTVVFDPDAIDTPGRFGFFDIAAITGLNFNGGFPNAGIPRGSTLHLQIVLTGSGLEFLDEDSFLGLFSSDRPRERKPKEDVQFFIGRFQRTGPGGGGSDVAIPSGPPTEVVLNVEVL